MSALEGGKITLLYFHTNRYIYKKKKHNFELKVNFSSLVVLFSFFSCLNWIF